MRVLLLACCLALFSFSFLSNVSAAPGMHATGLVDVPTAYTLPHGIFAVGGGAVFDLETDFPRQAVLLTADLGVLDRIEVGVINRRYQWLEEDASALLLNLKLQLLREQGGWPAIALGVEHIGDKALEEQAHSARYQTRSPFVVLSKELTLPKLQRPKLHLGWGDRRYRPDESSGDWTQGMFVAIEKRWEPRYLRGSVTWSLEYDAHGGHSGLRIRLNSGAEIQLALQQTGSEDWQCWFGAQWSNQQMLDGLEEAKRLARSAARLAIAEGGGDSTRDE